MTDTITESFCERCGTRYSFEQKAKPRRGGIGRVRVLTRGLKNYVANDGMPMNEAMAAARNDEERAGISLQLDAFHKTFNFCMSCRQYTCATCWNVKVGECLTCAPDLSREVLPAPFPDLAPAGPSAAEDLILESEAVASAAWPTADLARPTATVPPAATPDVAPVPDVSVPVEEPEVLARLESFVAGPAGGDEADLTAAELAEIETALASVRDVVEPPAEPVAAEVVPEPLAAAEVEPPAEPVAAELVPEPLAAAEVEPAPIDHAAIARGQTRSLLARFRPGRRPEAPASPAAAAGRAATPAEASLTPIAPPDLATEPAPTPQEAARPAPADAIEQPTWRIVAPDVMPAPRPEWPATPAWPSPDPRATPAASQIPAHAAAPWASRLATARPEPGSVWAASSQEVLAAPGVAAAGGPGPAVQACVSCGLSLSANARFCRRCGTRQS
jgi:hypothetical protein